MTNELNKGQLSRAIRVRVTEPDLVGGMLLKIADIALANERAFIGIHDRDDRRQDIALYLFQKLPNVCQRQNPFGYLLQIARNRLRKLQVRAKSKQGHRRVWEGLAVEAYAKLDKRRGRGR